VLDANLHLQPHDPDYAATHTLPFRYLPGKELSDAPLFHNFLKSVWGADRDYAQKVTALRDVMCMTLFGMGPSFARVVLLYGVAQSGKTQLLRIMENLMPNEAISRVPPYEFDARFRSARLAQSLMNVCGELSERKQIDGAKFKDFVDGGITDGEIKGKDFFQFSPKCTHWFSSNHLPKTQDSSDGFTRRWAVFTFERMLMSDERVRDLGQTIADAEREEIASWVAGAFSRLKTMGDLELPESHFKVITEMSAENDTVAFWYTAEGLRASPLPEWALKKPTLFHPSAAERGDLGKLKAHSLTDLYAHYSAFCIAQSGLKQVGKRRFSLRLRELGALKRFRIIPRFAEDVIDVLIYGIEGDSL
jgi:P4 family phage/plasmid primase-like protien